MRPANAEHTPTVFEIVKRAVEAVDPDADQGLDELLIRFEDRDEPVAGLEETIGQQIDEAVGALDPDEADPAIQMAGAVATYLAFRRDEVGDDRESILRLAARAEFDGSPPQPIADWLESEGVAL
jgi:hypothetical protein